MRVGFKQHRSIFSTTSYLAAASASISSTRARRLWPQLITNMMSTKNTHTRDAPEQDSLSSPSQKRQRRTTSQLPEQKEEPAPSTENKTKKGKTKRLKLADVDGAAENPNTAEYYFENGFRKVTPFHFCYATFVKGRWVKRSILDVFCKEFRDKSPEYYKEAIENGWVRINKETVTCDKILQYNDIISHRLHRHEPPITAESPEILENFRFDGSSSGGLLVVNKPASMTVHPSGRYHHNTLTHILCKEHGYKKLYPVNRLDRLTSGVTLLGTDEPSADMFAALIKSRKVLKEYVARVRGEFPKDSIECNEPILCESHKLGLNCVSAKGKACQTKFERLSFNGRTSVVKCTPRTGRTHQIRVHLQYLGYPIANDPLYGGPVWRAIPHQGAGVVDEESRRKIVDALIARGFAEDAESVARVAADPSSSTTSGSDSSAALRTFEPAPGCNECLRPKYSDPKPEQLCIWLHAMRYSNADVADENGADAMEDVDPADLKRALRGRPIPSFDFRSKLPPWAQPEFEGDAKILEALEDGVDLT